ncbi:hypothetical protein [uncultured Propionibacterium sp.]|uniref:hypothetical protein n=1 Tax=uncultured Propionibacterium sp. TaxID=218066 RepID=UPI00292E5C9B|nr:hypothetical protein [uncultured Propionibacterium sp.]
MSTNRKSTARRFSTRRAIEALGAAAAIAIGGLAVISPAEAHAAGVSRPLVIQTSPIQVQSAESTGNGTDEQ